MNAYLSEQSVAWLSVCRSGEEDALLFEQVAVAAVFSVQCPVEFIHAHYRIFKLLAGAPSS